MTKHSPRDAASCTWKTWRSATASPAASTRWTRRRSWPSRRRFDPQPFHLDPEAAEAHLLPGPGGQRLAHGRAHDAAAGRQRPPAGRRRDRLGRRAAVAAADPAGRRAARRERGGRGDALALEPERGMVQVRCETLNQRGEVLQRFSPKLVVVGQSVQRLGTRMHGAQRRAPRAFSFLEAVPIAIGGLGAWSACMPGPRRPVHANPARNECQELRATGYAGIWCGSGTGGLLAVCSADEQLNSQTRSRHDRMVRSEIPAVGHPWLALARLLCRRPV